MKKRLFFHINFLLLLSGIFNAVSAHTINHDLEQMYRSGFLPLFVMSILLPFIALGMLSSGHLKLGNKHIPLRILFISTLFIGFIAGLAGHIDLPFALFDSLYVLLTGILLLFLRSANAPAARWILIPSGLTLGIEYTLFFRHAHDFLWLYVSLFAVGIIFFWTLGRYPVIGHDRRKYLQHLAGAFFVIAGIVLLLMS